VKAASYFLDGFESANLDKYISTLQVSVGEGQMDIYSRLAKDRILLLGTDVNDEMANNLVAQVRFYIMDSHGWFCLAEGFADAFPCQ
jgi:hypothetical protein